MTNREIQSIENTEIEKMYNVLVDELNTKTPDGFYLYPWFRSGKLYGKRLRSSSAYVLETEHFYVLKSYQTIVAAIDKSSDTLYDFLRMVYGYTSTSAQHIAKFKHDYGAGKWGCEYSMVWRRI